MIITKTEMKPIEMMSNGERSSESCDDCKCDTTKYSNNNCLNAFNKCDGYILKMINKSYHSCSKRLTCFRHKRYVR